MFLVLLYSPKRLDIPETKLQLQEYREGTGSTKRLWCRRQLHSCNR